MTESTNLNLLLVFNQKLNLNSKIIHDKHTKIKELKLEGLLTTKILLRDHF